MHVAHVVPAAAVDDDLAGLLHEELFGPGWLRGTDLFERVFTGVVRTSAEDALDSWELFYRNTLRRLDDPGHARGAGAATTARSTATRPVHDHVLGAARRPARCWSWAAASASWRCGSPAPGRATTASDVSAGTVRLLAAIAPAARACGWPPRPRTPPATRPGRLRRHGAGDPPARAPRAGARQRRWSPRRCASPRARVVVAVPLEDEADETYGHVRTVTLDDLHRWGRGTGCAYDVHEFHGGWLVVDKR